MKKNKSNQQQHQILGALEVERADTPLSSCTSNTNASETIVKFGQFEIELLSKDDEIDLAVRTFKITKKSSSNNFNSSTLDSNRDNNNLHNRNNICKNSSSES